MLPVIFGLISALSWGAGDFCGGLATRRGNVYTVIIISDFVGGVLILALALRDPMPGAGDLLTGAVAGVAGVLGLIALYRALASGTMSIASPLAAIVTGALPVGYGALTEGLPGQWQLIGFVFALLGVWLLSSTARLTIQWRHLGLPVLAGLGFGTFFILIGRVSHSSVYWPLVTGRFAATAAIFLYAAFTRQLAWPTHRRDLALTLAVGVLDVGGNAFYALAAHAGRLDVAAVLSSLYPASTVALAWLVLKERMSRQQLVGVGAALIAIALIAL